LQCIIYRSMIIIYNTIITIKLYTHTYLYIILCVSFETLCVYFVSDKQLGGVTFARWITAKNCCADTNSYRVYYYYVLCVHKNPSTLQKTGPSLNNGLILYYYMDYNNIYYIHTHYTMYIIYVQYVNS